MTIYPLNTSNFDPGIFILKAIKNNPKLAESTKIQYKKAVINYLATGQSITDPQALTEYASNVGSSTASFLKAAVKVLTKEVEMQAKSGATVANILEVQAMVYRAEALQSAITIKTPKGSKAHTWLSQKEIAKLLKACNRRKSGKREFEIVGQRDRLAIGLLVAAGLRRQEAVNLKFSDVQIQPIGDKVRTVLNVKGKGAKDRIIPISNRLADAIGTWGAFVGLEGYVLRSLGRNKQVGENMSTTALYNIIQKRGTMIGKPDLQPHDLRRTFAQLGYEAGIDIAQISTLLGHANLETTQRYLNLQIDLEETISDYIPFDG